MPPNEAMTLLMSSLTDAQRGKLTGKEGLGLSDLKDDMQKHLFQTMMPKDQCDVNQRTEPGKDDVSVTLDNMGIKALGAKLRIKQEVQILTKGKQDYYSYVQTYSKVNDKPVFNLNDYSAYNNLDKLGGIAIRITLPNAPKQSQLDILAPALQAAVSPDGVKTVGELIERIAKGDRLGNLRRHPLRKASPHPANRQKNRACAPIFSAPSPFASREPIAASALRTSSPTTLSALGRAGRLSTIIRTNAVPCAINL